MSTLIVLGGLGWCLCAGETDGIPLSDIHLRDPFILPVAHEGKYYLFGTGTHLPPGPGFDGFVSTDLAHWQGPFKVFRGDAAFEGTRDFWAPEAHAYQGRYYLFATFKAPNACRGTRILVADKPGGPYRAHSDGPVTPPEWECLDGTLFIDEAGTPWMVFCHEWVQVGDGEICAIRLSPGLDGPVGAPILLFHASDAPWADHAIKRPNIKEPDGLVTDGPFLYRAGNGHLLMLWSSAGKSGYRLGVARSESGALTGPWLQESEALFADDGGHGMLFRSFDGDLLLCLHAPNRRSEERPRLFSVSEADGRLAIAPFQPAGPDDAQQTPSPAVE
ncbi:MAG: family 43 glycosylhydrolase [Candidatus Hydrogenedentes bacterium]|nr:family 43 glycosylhydrolase [Candidatus Hydrogenedentota bacterium]